MAKSMTLEEVKKAKMDLELEVVKMFKQFEDDTELKIGYTVVIRKRKKRARKGPEIEEPYEPYQGPIEDVKIEVNLDLVY